MKEQNYSNHVRYVKGFHFVTFSFIVILLIGSIYSLYDSIKGHTDLRYSLMFLIITGILFSIFFYLRIFSLKAQDRAIRAEENLRCYVLTGKVFDPKLKISQILALRFAPDAEFIELYEKSVTESLRADDIKKAIKEWKADHHRA